jgi:uncharacterized damage-inducible protein DinB
MGFKNTYLDEVMPLGELILQEFAAIIEPLDEAQLNWKPEQQAWSLGQILEHLFQTSLSYIDIIDKLLNHSYKKSFLEKFTFWSNFWGNFLFKAMQPQNSNPLKAPTAFEPEQTHYSKLVFDKFQTQQLQLLKLIEKSDRLSHTQTIITSPAARFITYSLENAILIIFMHQKRHLEQAKRLVERLGSPQIT